MLIIRLARTGRRNDPNFRIVLQEKFRKPTGRVIEFLGFYNPRLKSKKIKEERVKYWLSQGAQTSATVHNLLVKEKIIVASKRKASKTKHKKRQGVKLETGTKKEEKSVDKKSTQEEDKAPLSSVEIEPKEQKTKPDLLKKEDEKRENKEKE